MASSKERQRGDSLGEALTEFQIMERVPSEGAPSDQEALLEFEEVSQGGAHEATCRCEYCGQSLPDMGMGFIEHVEANEACAWQWDQQQPYILEDAGGE